MKYLNNKCKILSIFAHREDHVVFGWPILQGQDENIKKYHLVCVDEHCETVKNSCLVEGINYVGNCGLKNGFAKPHRNILKNKFLPNNYDYLRDEINAAIIKVKPDVLFTHNPMGEYGHYDHRMVFEVVCNEFNDLPIIITDITAKSSYYKHHRNIPQTFQHLYNEKIDTVKPDIQYYERNKQYFEKVDAWTNNENLNPPEYPNDSGLYLIR